MTDLVDLEILEDVRTHFTQKAGVEVIFTELVFDQPRIKLLRVNTKQKQAEILPISWDKQIPGFWVRKQSSSPTSQCNICFPDFLGWEVFSVQAKTYSIYVTLTRKEAKL